MNTTKQIDSKLYQHPKSPIKKINNKHFSYSINESKFNKNIKKYNKYSTTNEKINKNEFKK